MAAFMTIAAILCLGVAIVFAWPMRHRSRIGFACTMLAIPLLAVGLYRVVGTPAALELQASAPPASMEDAISQLEDEMQRNPQQLEGWQLLARAYAEQGHFGKSRDAFEHAAKLAPDDGNAQISYAEARAKADPQRRFDDIAISAIEKVLQREPQNQRALWFLGVAQRQRGEHAAAAHTWESLLPIVDPATVAALRPQIDAARTDAGLPPLPVPAHQATASAEAGNNAIVVKVSLAPGLAERIRLHGDARVFVIARIPGGPPMPVAAEKHPASALPLTITLDDTDSPMPTAKLSAMKEVELIARVSASGEASRQEGDLESMPVRVTLPAKGPVDLVIDTPAR